MRTRMFAILALLLMSVISVASTCPVCYGETDTNTASAVNAAIFTLLLVIGAVLSFFVSIAYQIRKRMKLSATNSSNESH